MSTFRNIHIGVFIEKLVKEKEIDHERLLNFFKETDIEFLEKSFSSASIDTDVLLKWSKLLEYDFFRIYSQHLILYAPPSALFCKSP